MMNGTLTIENMGATLIARLDGGPRQEFGAELLRQLEALVTRADADPAVRAVVLTSAHPSRFISHADVSWLQKGGLEFVARQKLGADAPPLPPDYVGLDRLHAVFLRMNSSGVVFVAALEGAALGLGAELTWACDARVMSETDAFIGQPEVLLGIMPGGGGSQRLARLVGGHRALMAIAGGAPLSPAEALHIGAVDALAPRAQVVAKALELAAPLTRRDKAALGAIKRAVYLGGSLPLPDALKFEAGEFLRLTISETGQKQMLAYQANTEANGELPLYQPGGYAAALESGRTPV